MKLFIKNMNGRESNIWLRSQLHQLDIPHEEEICLGEVVLQAVIPTLKLAQLRARLEMKGMSLIYERKTILSEQVKYLLKDMVELKNRPEENYSQFISNRLHLNYTYLANIFSETQNMTIEHYIISLKIEKVKELLTFSDHNISCIADIMEYSSIGHLSNQFKKVTGMSPTKFKKQLTPYPFTPDTVRYASR